MQDPNVAWLEVELPSYPKPVEFPSQQRVYELGAAVDDRSLPELKVKTGAVCIREGVGMVPGRRAERGCIVRGHWTLDRYTVKIH